MVNISLLEKSIPVAPIKIAALESCAQLASQVDSHLVKFRKELKSHNPSGVNFRGYTEDSFLIDCECPRFGSGEAKGVIGESIRGTDMFIMVDVCNHSLTYKICGHVNHMSPDDHYQDLKRIIATSVGKAHRINVIMPFLYESRQHRRTKRESLDCALALQELVQMGVSNIITFDAHDPRMQNAIPLSGFDNFMPTYQFLKTMVASIEDFKIDNEHLMIISPDEGAMGRAVYFSNILGVDMGMFYKRRDYSTIKDGKNPIVAHEFLGDSVEGKDVIIIASKTLIAPNEQTTLIGLSIFGHNPARFELEDRTILSTGGEATFSAQEAGEYEISYIVRDNDNNEVRDSITITIKDQEEGV